jgi:Family of unknown function (DUF5519)
MAVGAGDPCWEAFVAAMLPLEPVEERCSRFADKPALFLDGREIAHLEAPGVIDLRITRPGWMRARDSYGEDPAVRRVPSRRDWLELALRSTAEIDRLTPLLTVAVAANLR